MYRIEIELNSSGIKELLHTKKLENVLRDAATEIKEHCGKRKDEYAVGTFHAPSRVIASVITDTPAAINSNKKHNTLLKALGEVSRK